MKKLIVLFCMVTPFMANSQVAKIDIIKGEIYTYGFNGENLNSYVLDSVEYSGFISTFCDSANVVSVNDSLPIKRVMQFYDILNGVPRSFVELDYVDMDSTDKSTLNVFIQKIKDL